jgi:hypothetical protein
MFKIDTHVHTSETSPCGRIPAAEMVALYASTDADAVVIADHYYEGFFERLEGGWACRVDAYLRGYRAARAAGEALGIRVLLGVELRVTDAPNDYLVLGVDEAWLYEHPRLYERSLDEVSSMVSAAEALLVAAHPFRPGMEPVDPALVHGVEVLNGHPGQTSNNARALAFAQEHDLLMTGGSDAHFLEGVNRAWMLFERLPEDARDLACAMRRGEVAAIRGVCGSVISPVRARPAV